MNADDDPGESVQSRLTGPSVPEVDVPEVDVPEVEVPSTPAGDPEFDGASDVDPAVQRLFWRLVVVFDVALLALALGPMFIYFEGDWSTGGAMTALGVGSLVYGVSEYRDYRDGD